jgi:hypothetical protein
MSGMIRSPARLYSRIPHISILVRRPPVPVFVEILSTDDIPRNVARSGRVVKAAIPTIGPSIELIWFTDLLYVCVESIVSAEGRTLPFVHGIRLPVAGRFALAFPDGDHCMGSIVTGLQLVYPWPKNGECLVGSIDLNHVVVVQTPHADIDSARTELNLNGPVIQVEKRNSCVAGKMDGSRVQFHFRARILICP